MWTRPDDDCTKAAVLFVLVQRRPQRFPFIAVTSKRMSPEQYRRPKILFFSFFLNPADGERSRKETTWAKKMVLWYTMEWWRFPITRQTRRRGGKKKGTNGTVRLDYRQCIEAPTRTISSSLPTSAAGRVAAFFFPFAIIGSFQNSHTAAEWNRNNNSNSPKRKVTFNAVVYIYTLYGRQWLRPAFQILIRKNQVPYCLPPSRLDFWCTAVVRRRRIITAICLFFFFYRTAEKRIGPAGLNVVPS